MDLEDEYLMERRDPALFRRVACRCVALPRAPETGSGCACATCGTRCRACPGFGNAEPPARRFSRILAAVTSQIRRYLKRLGHEPGYIRLPPREIRVIVEKIKREDPEHWTLAERWIDPGPPLRILDVFVVEDHRRGR